VGEMAVEVEVVQSSAGECQDVDIRSIGGKNQDGRRIRGQTIETGPAQKEAGERMGDVIQ
jgi:hypothetical protein